MKGNKETKTVITEESQKPFGNTCISEKVRKVVALANEILEMTDDISNYTDIENEMLDELSNIRSLAKEL